MNQQNQSSASDWRERWRGSWASDKRLIPPDGASVPSQHEETRGTSNCEARGGVTSNENASKLCYSTIRKGKTGNADADETQGAVNKLKSHDINKAVDNANADELQGATDKIIKEVI